MMELSQREWENLTVDQKIQMLGIMEKKRNNDIEERAHNSKKKYAYVSSFLGLFGVLLTVVGGGLFIRDSDLAKIYDRIENRPTTESDIRIENIERNISLLTDQIRTDHNAVYTILPVVHDINRTINPKKYNHQGQYLGVRSR